jgi:long-subunit acyl-CoA synthetase (AMP-forming)
MTASQQAQSSPVTGNLRNLAVALRWRARKDPDRVVARDLDGTVEITWDTALSRIEAFASGLHRLGVRRGDAVALMLKNRPEVLIADFACLSLGAAPFSIYASLPPVQIQPILENSGARVIVCEQAFLDQVLGARELVPSLEHVILLDGEGVGTVPWSQVEGDIDPELDFDALAEEVSSDDLATIIYTSGTTGPPKGVELSHRNIIAGGLALNRVFGVEADQRVVCWLPLAHMADRAGGIYWPVLIGTRVTYVEETARIVEALMKVQPHLWFGAPRLFEKLRVVMLGKLQGMPDPDRAERAVETGREVVRRRRDGEPIPPDLQEELQVAEEEILRPLRTAFGFGEAHIVLTGGAPMPAHVTEFFHSIGVPLSETYGMTETATVGTTTPKGEPYPPGALGRPQPGVDIKIAEDGEILVRHEAVTRGYRANPEATAAAFTEDGYLRTGDLGSWTDDGLLRLIGRKKELIVNSYGKNMSPVNIEETIKGAGSLIGQICAIGDGRPYNSALVVLDVDSVPAWAAREGLGDGLTLEELAVHPRVIDAVGAQVEAGNQKLSRVEQIRRFHIVPGDWLPSGDEMTPTMKLKRNSIVEKYKADISALYD